MSSGCDCKCLQEMPTCSHLLFELFYSYRSNLWPKPTCTLCRDVCPQDVIGTVDDKQSVGMLEPKKKLKVLFMQSPQVSLDTNPSHATV